MVIHVTFNHSVIGSNPVDPIYNVYSYINISEVYLRIEGARALKKKISLFVLMVRPAAPCCDISLTGKTSIFQMFFVSSNLTYRILNLRCKLLYYISRRSTAYVRSHMQPRHTTPHHTHFILRRSLHTHRLRTD